MNNTELEAGIGKRIKAARKAKHITQRKLEELCGIKSSVLSIYENSKKTPGLTNLAKISRALEVSLDELYFGNENERFINAAADEAEKAVNCFIELWKLGYLDYVVNFNADDVDYAGAGHKKFLRTLKNEPAIQTLFRHLQDYKTQEYQDGEYMLEQYRNSAINEIRKASNK